MEKTDLKNKEVGKRPLIGATRWDALTGINHDKCWVLDVLQYDLWDDRSPDFLKKIDVDKKIGNENSQSVIDKEIEQASKGGIDYWAFIDAPSKNPNSSERYALEKYLSSYRKKDIKFCIVIHKYNEQEEAWDLRCDRYVNYMKDPQYVKVLDNRPLLFIFNVIALEEEFGEGDGTLKAMQKLRNKALSVGLNPYIVSFSYGFGQNLDAEIMNKNIKYDFDGISCYGFPGDEGGNNGDSFSKLSAQNVIKWKNMASTGMKVIPPVTLGWDTRPMQMTPPGWPICPGEYFNSPTPDECADQIKKGINFVKENTEVCEANSILVYSWNEFCEGAWLNPTIKNGSDRLDAIKGMLDSI